VKRPAESGVPSAPASASATGPGADSERILGNMAGILAARVGGQGLRLLAMLRMAAYLDAEGFGVLGFVVSSLEVFRFLVNFGLETVTVRALALGSPPPRTLMRHLLMVKAGMAVLVFGLLVVLTMTVDALGGERRGLVLLLATGLLPQAWAATLTARFQAQHAMDRLVPFTVGAGAVQLLAVDLAARAGLGVGSFVAILTAVDYLTLGLTALAARSLPWPGSRTRDARREEATPPDLHLMAALLRQAVPLAVLEILFIVYSRLGVFFLERQRGLMEVGQYFAALRLTEPLMAVGGALAVTLLPGMARLTAVRDVAGLSRRFRRASLLAAAASFSAAALLSLVAEPLLRFLHPEYLPAAPALRVLAFASAVMVQNQLSSSVMHAAGRYHVVTACSTVNLGVYLIAALILVPRLGTLGAALSTLVTESLNAMVQLTLVRRWVQGLGESAGTPGILGVSVPRRGEAGVDSAGE
jgi:O-antigen/teichoic acid export membrane protein